MAFITTLLTLPSSRILAGERTWLLEPPNSNKVGLSIACFRKSRPQAPGMIPANTTYALHRHPEGRQPGGGANPSVHDGS